MAPADGQRPVLIQVFARVPVPGRVKTRLAAAVGDERAASIYRRLAERMLRCAARAARTDRGSALFAPHAELWVDGDASSAWVQAMATRHRLRVREQAAGDIGDRMRQALAVGLGQGCWPLLVGTDCPGIDGHYLRRAAMALAAGTPLVLGPVEDGGYALIGVRADFVNLFVDMPWSTDLVTAETLRRAHAAGVRSTCLPTRHDIDTAADLQRHEAGLRVAAERRRRRRARGVAMSPRAERRTVRAVGLRRNDRRARRGGIRPPDKVSS